MRQSHPKRLDRRTWSAAVIVLFVLPIPLFRHTPRTDPASWEALVADFQGRGIAVISNHPRCQEPDLYGLYIRGRKQLVVCERGDRSATLRHEGWHLVQSLCLLDQAWLDREAIERALSRQDRNELALLVRAERWSREAEARAMANLPLDLYLSELDRACRQRLPRQIP